MNSVKIYKGLFFIWKVMYNEDFVLKCIFKVLFYILYKEIGCFFKLIIVKNIFFYR